MPQHLWKSHPFCIHKQDVFGQTRENMLLPLSFLPPQWANEAEHLHRLNLAHLKAGEFQTTHSIFISSSLPLSLLLTE